MALEAPLLTRKRVIQVSLESVKGDGTAAATDILVFDLSLEPTDAMVTRDGTGKGLGHTSPAITDGEGKGTCRFKTELRGTGSNDIDPALRILLQGLGLEETPAKTFKPTSVYATQKTLNFTHYQILSTATDKAIQKSLKGAMGTGKLISDKGRMILDLEFSGVYVIQTKATAPTVAYSTRKPINWGYSTNAFTLASQSIKISKFEFDFGNKVVPRMNNGAVSHYMISDRDPTITIDPETDLVANYDLYGAWLAGTEVAASMVLREATDIFTFSVPKFQYRTPKAGDRDGILIDDVTGQCNISVMNTGDDEYTFAVS